MVAERVESEVESDDRVPVVDYMASHPNCRCRMSPVWKTWTELGFPEIDAELEGRPEMAETRAERWKTGDQLLAAHPARVQKRVLGRQRYALWKRPRGGGGPLNLDQMVRARPNPDWGRMMRLRPVDDLLAELKAIQEAGFETGPLPTLEEAPVSYRDALLSDAQEQAPGMTVEGDKVTFADVLPGDAMVRRLEADGLTWEQKPTAVAEPEVDYSDLTSFDAAEWEQLDIFRERKPRFLALPEGERDKLANAPETISRRVAELVTDRLPPRPHYSDPMRSIHERLAQIDAAGLVPKDTRTVIARFATELDRAMREAHTSPDTRRTIGLELLDIITAQEVETLGRVLGDHGVRHIYGDASMAVRILEASGGITPMDRVLMYVAAAIHDTGYLTPPARVFLDEDHPHWAAQFMEAKLGIWLRRVLESASTDYLHHIIDSHAESDMNWEGDRARAAFRLADNLAVFHAEKLPALFNEVTPNTQVLIDLGRGVIDIDTARERMRLNTALAPNLSDTVRRRLFQAIEEVNPTLPKFTAGMLGARIGHIGWNVDHPTIELIRTPANDALQKVLDVGARAFRKFAETFGIDPDDFLRTKHLEMRDKAGRVVLESDLHAREQRVAEAEVSYEGPSWRDKGPIDAMKPDDRPPPHIYDAKAQHQQALIAKATPRVNRKLIAKLVDRITGPNRQQPPKDFTGDWQGADGQAYRARMDAEAKRLLSPEAVELRVRMPLEALDRMLAAGRFETQFESRTSEGLYAPGRRQLTEAARFGMEPPHLAWRWDDIKVEGSTSNIWSNFRPGSELRHALQADSYYESSGLGDLAGLPAFAKYEAGRLVMLATRGRGGKLTLYVPDTEVGTRSFGYQEEQLGYDIGMRWNITKRPDTTDVQDHPVYGYVAPKTTDAVGVEQYGDIIIRLRNGVRKRTTVTQGDSLDSLNFYRPTLTPDGTMEVPDASAPQAVEPIDAVDHLVFDWGKPSTSLDALQKVTSINDLLQLYWEAQFHGGLTLDDINEVLIPADLLEPIEGVPEARPGEPFTTALDAAGVPWRTYDREHDMDDLRSPAEKAADVPRRTTPVRPVARPPRKAPRRVTSENVERWAGVAERGISYAPKPPKPPEPPPLTFEEGIRAQIARTRSPDRLAWARPQDHQDLWTVIRGGMLNEHITGTIDLSDPSAYRGDGVETVLYENEPQGVIRPYTLSDGSRIAVLYNDPTSTSRSNERGVSAILVGDHIYTNPRRHLIDGDIDITRLRAYAREQGMVPEGVHLTETTSDRFEFTAKEPVHRRQVGTEPIAQVTINVDSNAAFNEATQLYGDTFTQDERPPSSRLADAGFGRYEVGQTLHRRTPVGDGDVWLVTDHYGDAVAWARVTPDYDVNIVVTPNAGHYDWAQSLLWDIQTYYQTHEVAPATPAPPKRLQASEDWDALAAANAVVVQPTDTRPDVDVYALMANIEQATGLPHELPTDLLTYGGRQFTLVSRGGFDAVYVGTSPLAYWDRASNVITTISGWSEAYLRTMFAERRHPVPGADMVFLAPGSLRALRPPVRPVTPTADFLREDYPAGNVHDYESALRFIGDRAEAVMQRPGPGVNDPLTGLRYTDWNGGDPLPHFGDADYEHTTGPRLWSTGENGPVVGGYYDVDGTLLAVFIAERDPATHRAADMGLVYFNPDAEAARRSPAGVSAGLRAWIVPVDIRENARYDELAASGNVVPPTRPARGAEPRLAHVEPPAPEPPAPAPTPPRRVLAPLDPGADINDYIRTEVGVDETRVINHRDRWEEGLADGTMRNLFETIYDVPPAPGGEPTGATVRVQYVESTERHAIPGIIGGIIRYVDADGSVTHILASFSSSYGTEGFRAGNFITTERLGGYPVGDLMRRVQGDVVARMHAYAEDNNQRFNEGYGTTAPAGAAVGGGWQTQTGEHFGARRTGLPDQMTESPHEPGASPATHWDDPNNPAHHVLVLHNQLATEPLGPAWAILDYYDDDTRPQLWVQDPLDAVMARADLGHYLESLQAAGSRAATEALYWLHPPGEAPLQLHVPPPTELGAGVAYRRGPAEADNFLGAQSDSYRRQLSDRFADRDPQYGDIFVSVDNAIERGDGSATWRDYVYYDTHNLPAAVLSIDTESGTLTFYVDRDKLDVAGTDMVLGRLRTMVRNSADINDAIGVWANGHWDGRYTVAPGPTPVRRAPVGQVVATSVLPGAPPGPMHPARTDYDFDGDVADIVAHVPEAAQGVPGEVKFVRWSVDNYYGRTEWEGAILAYGPGGEPVAKVSFSMDRAGRYAAHVHWTRTHPDYRRMGYNTRIYEWAQAHNVRLEEISGEALTSVGATYFRSRRAKPFSRVILGVSGWRSGEMGKLTGLTDVEQARKDPRVSRVSAGIRRLARSLGLEVRSVDPTIGLFSAEAEPSNLVELDASQFYNREQVKDIDGLAAAATRKWQQDAVIETFVGDVKDRLDLPTNGKLIRISGLPKDHMPVAFDAVGKMVPGATINGNDRYKDPPVAGETDVRYHRALKPGSKRLSLGAKADTAIEVSVYDAEMTPELERKFSDLAKYVGGHLEVIDAHIRWVWQDIPTELAAREQWFVGPEEASFTADEVKGVLPESKAKVIVKPRSEAKSTKVKEGWVSYGGVYDWVHGDPEAPALRREQDLLTRGDRRTAQRVGGRASARARTRQAGLRAGDVVRPLAEGRGATLEGLDFRAALRPDITAQSRWGEGYRLEDAQSVVLDLAEQSGEAILGYLSTHFGLKNSAWNTEVRYDPGMPYAGTFDETTGRINLGGWIGYALTGDDPAEGRGRLLKTLTHELVHSLSPHTHQEYVSYKPWEEAVAEGIAQQAWRQVGDRVFGKKVAWDREGGPGTYLGWREPIVDMARTLGIDEAEFYVFLAQRKLRERAGWVRDTALGDPAMTGEKYAALCVDFALLDNRESSTEGGADENVSRNDYMRGFEEVRTRVFDEDKVTFYTRLLKEAGARNAMVNWLFTETQRRVAGQYSDYQMAMMDYAQGHVGTAEKMLRKYEKGSKSHWANDLERLDSKPKTTWVDYREYIRERLGDTYRVQRQVMDTYEQVRVALGESEATFWKNLAHFPSEVRENVLRERVKDKLGVLNPKAYPLFDALYNIRAPKAAYKAVIPADRLAGPDARWSERSKQVYATAKTAIDVAETYGFHNRGWTGKVRKGHEDAQGQVVLAWLDWDGTMVIDERNFRRLNEQEQLFAICHELAHGVLGIELSEFVPHHGFEEALANYVAALIYPEVGRRMGIAVDPSGGAPIMGYMDLTAIMQEMVVNAHIDPKLFVERLVAKPPNDRLREVVAMIDEGVANRAGDYQDRVDAYFRLLREDEALSYNGPDQDEAASQGATRAIIYYTMYCLIDEARRMGAAGLNPVYDYTLGDQLTFYSRLLAAPALEVVYDQQGQPHHAVHEHDRMSLLSGALQGIVDPGIHELARRLLDGDLTGADIRPILQRAVDRGVPIDAAVSMVTGVVPRGAYYQVGGSDGGAVTTGQGAAATRLFGGDAAGGGVGAARYVGVGRGPSRGLGPVRYPGRRPDAAAVGAARLVRERGARYVGTTIAQGPTQRFTGGLAGSHVALAQSHKQPHGQPTVPATGTWAVAVAMGLSAGLMEEQGATPSTAGMTAEQRADYKALERLRRRLGMSRYYFYTRLRGLSSAEVPAAIERLAVDNPTTRTASWTRLYAETVRELEA